jgi:hypothetical protein
MKWKVKEQIFGSTYWNKKTKLIVFAIAFAKEAKNILNEYIDKYRY